MKSNQKGFTLIELLAVIVILAIIALIATPIVLSSINDSRKKAAEDSTYGVIEAVRAKYAEMMLESSSIGDNMKVQWNDGVGIVDGTSEKVEVNGTKPASGTIEVDSNGTIKVEKLVIGGYTCSGSDTITCSSSSNNE